MTQYVKYDVNTGEILGTRISDEPLSVGLLEGHASPGTHYVDLQTMAIMPKNPNPAILDVAAIRANGTDEATITGIPPGTEMIISVDRRREKRITALDSVLIITSTAAADITVFLIASITVLSAQLIVRAS